MPTADELYQEANCFLCYGITQTQALKIALLRRQVLELDPNANVSPEALLASAACYNCYANGSVGDLLELALLAIIAATPCTGNVDGLIWGPSPETVDSLTDNADATLTFLSSLTNGSAYTTLSFGNPTTVTNGVAFTGSIALTSITFRLLETVGTGFDISGSTLIVTISAPLLQSAGTEVDLQGNAALTAVSFPSLTTVGTDFLVIGSTLVTTISLPVLASIGNDLDISGTGIINATFPSLVTVTNQINVSGGVVEVLSLPVLSAYPVAGIVADAALLTLNLPACVDDGAGQLNTDLAAMIGLVTLNLASLTSVTADFDGSIASLASLTLTSLVSVGGSFSINTSALTSLSLPALTTITVDLNAGPVVGLASFSAPVWLPTNGTTIDFNGCALDAASVEGILRRCMVAGVTTCTISVDGGTNAGLASLSAQGQTDAADLVTAGNTLNINP